MNTAALRAQMSAMRISRSVGLRGSAKCTVKRAEHLAVTADQRRRMHRAHAFARPVRETPRIAHRARYPR